MKYTRGIFALILYGINLVILPSLLFLFGFFYWIIPLRGWRKYWQRAMNWLPSCWIAINNAITDLTTHISWDISGVSDLKKNDWYLMMANHQSWADILVLQRVFNRKIPMLKFFIKKELLWTLPFAGLACWLLDFPFMARHSKSVLAKHPELKGKDIETTRKACEKFKYMPSTVISFVEGTRFSAEKQQRQASPYQYLLRPKAGGIAFALSALGESFHKFLNVTIVYSPSKITVWDYFCGKVKKVTVRVETLPITPDLLGDYENNRKYRAYFQSWLNQVWSAKDKLIKDLHAHSSLEVQQRNNSVLRTKGPIRTLKIATRKSPLAMWQAAYVKAKLELLYPELTIELLGMTTEGDRQLDTSLAKIGGKGLFVKELETALLEGRADLAVHSMKDVPMEFPIGLGLAAILEREDPRDAFVASKYNELASLPPGARLGTSSLRRQCQLQALRPDIEIISLRGNVNTRLRRLDEGEFDAIILAAAGLLRLELADRINQYLPIETCLPAIGQGALGIEYRLADTELYQLLAPLTHPATYACVTAERAFSRVLGASCQVPVAGYATLIDTDLTLRGLVGRPDGTLLLQAILTGDVTAAETIGINLAKELLAQGAGEILQALSY